MQALSHRPDPVAPAHRSQGFGRISQPHSPFTPGRVMALPRLHSRPQSQPLVSTALRRLARLIARGWSAWCEWQLARHNQRALRGLDDRTLRDLGLTRSDLASSAEPLAAGERPKGWQ